MRKKPKFSIIMPTLNRAFCINNAIDSILAQSYPNFELIIIDDGSTDNTEAQIREKYAQELEDGHIVFYRFDNPVGVCKARNKGIELAKNPWIGYIDSDNRAAKDYLLTFAEAIKTTKAKTYYAQSQLDICKSIVGKPFNHKSLWLKNFIDTGIFVHAKSVSEKLGGYDEKMTRIVDWEIAVRYTKVYKPTFIPQIVLHYNDSNDHIRITNSVECTHNWEYFFKKHMYPLPKKKRQNTLGIIRYSCNCLNQYNKNALDPEYFQHRFDIFKDVTLKGLIAQSDQNFNIILLHSDNLPEHAKLKFCQLEHMYPLLNNVYIKDGESINSAIKESMNNLLNLKQKSTITFRLDNDDALPVDFIKNLKKYARPQHQGKVVTMPSITAVQRIGQDKYLYHTRQYPSNSIGLAYISTPQELKSIMELGNHARVEENTPLIIDHNQGGLQTINGENCHNHIKDKQKAKELTIEGLNKKLSKHFPKMNLTCLRVIPNA